MVFNLLPLPPLDGGRVAVGPAARAVGLAVVGVEPYGFFILIGLMLTGVLGYRHSAGRRTDDAASCGSLVGL